MKDFILLGNLNALTAKICFKKYVEGHIRLGHSKRGGGVAMQFDYKNGEKLLVSTACWYTSLPSYIPPQLELKEEYTADKYPKYDNYDAINCDKSSLIPKDYYGVMGVPLTFAKFLNTEQFDIIGALNVNCPEYYWYGQPLIKGKCKYFRLLIKRK